MPEAIIRFGDGAAYDEGMGRWSRPVGELFLDWLAPEKGLRWIDVGCGSGVFSGLLMERCAPAEVQGVDPSAAQLTFARGRANAHGATFQLGDAMALPFPDNRFDAAGMALAIAFVPEPAKGVAEMARVVRPGGLVATYMWDSAGGASPFHPIQAELGAMGFATARPPSPDASRLESLRVLWRDAGIDAVEVRQITVRRTFPDFDAFWAASTLTGGVRMTLAEMTGDDIARVKDRVRARLPADPEGGFTHSARANAIKGRLPG
jgi:SAM-dependent methyltransferase